MKREADGVVSVTSDRTAIDLIKDSGSRGRGEDNMSVVVKKAVSKRLLRLGACGCAVLLASLLATSQAAAEPPDARMSLIRGTLLIGKFRTQRELNAMSWEDQRNTLITELVARTRDDVRFYQGLNDTDLAGAGSLLVYLRETSSRTDDQIKTMSADDMRNTVIVEVGVQTGRGRDLQALSNLQLIHLVMGPERSFIRGVLLVGRFRTQRELNAMSGEDQRNTLITELVGRTRDNLAFYQGLNDRDLAGTGALLVYLRGTGSRTDEQIKTMSADDMRNTVIVEMHEQVHRTDLQGLTNMQLALTALGSHEVRSPDNLPELQRPGQHTLVLRADRVFTWHTVRRFSDVPVLGPFIGRGIDCSHGWLPQGLAVGSGESLIAVAGWGQVEGNGHPGASTDPCMSWVSQLTLNFDTRPFDTLPRKTLDRAVLAYREQAASECVALVYTQGGFLVDPLPCWTDGDANPEFKPNGCLSLRVPNEDWVRSPPNRAIGWFDSTFGVGKSGPSSWDVTGLFRGRHMPGLGQPDMGVGYMLTGDPLTVGNLSAEDNTRCTSALSDIRLEVTYTVPPIPAEYDVDVH
ncbi:hypothetical protein [Hyalangium versicolor]|uniref:hypothetical protein n=1 Tax=Hyalangium versicolor TaxID=2861190 RepID=UPI001CCB8160|nr:hypothetical protein [Hyalangium versicolor]